MCPPCLPLPLTAAVHVGAPVLVLRCGAGAAPSAVATPAARPAAAMREPPSQPGRGDDTGKKKRGEIKPIPGRLTLKLIGGRCGLWEPPRFAHGQRCVCVCVSCRGLQRHERGSKASKTKINPYFKLELGGAHSIKKRSTPIKNTNSTPDFKGEVHLTLIFVCVCVRLHVITHVVVGDPCRTGNHLRHHDTKAAVAGW